MTDWSLSDRIFVMHFREQFSKEIGLKSSILSGLSFLGINAMIEELMLLRSMLSEQKSFSNLVKPSFIICQNFFMKRPLKPSGPGAWL